MVYANEADTYGNDHQERYAVSHGKSFGKRAALAAQIERHQAQAEYAAQKLAQLESLPDEPVADNDEPSVIWFTKVFQNGHREYTYAAVRDSRGLWNTTGPNSPKAYTWDQLVEWMYDGESCEAWFATGYEPLQ